MYSVKTCAKIIILSERRNNSGIMPEVCNGSEPPKRLPNNQKSENMLYSEFIDRVGRVRTVEDYHTKVEPEYYNFPGNKDEFCLQFIGRELHRVNDEYMDKRERLEKALNEGDDVWIAALTEIVKLYDKNWHILMEHRQALIKRMYN